MRSRRWAEYTANAGCNVNNGNLFNSAFTDANGCVAGEDCGDYTAAFFTCPVSDDDGEETTKAPETTKPEETTKPDEETTKPEEETEGPTEGPTEPPTTTAKPFDPDTDCGFENGTGKKEKVQWKGKNNGKVIAYSHDSAIIRFNFFNTAPAYDLTNEDYIGFLGFPKKLCGIDLLNKIEDGTVKMTFNDYGAFYEEKSKFLRLDQQHTSMMVQISRKKVDGERDLPGLGNTKKDQVWIAMSGLAEVDFGNKEWITCLESVQAGTMNANENDMESELAPCAAWDIDLGWSG